MMVRVSPALIDISPELGCASKSYSARTRLPASICFRTENTQQLHNIRENEGKCDIRQRKREWKFKEIGWSVEMKGGCCKSEFWNFIESSEKGEKQTEIDRWFSRLSIESLFAVCRYFFCLSLSHFLYLRSFLSLLCFPPLPFLPRQIILIFLFHTQIAERENSCSDWHNHINKWEGEGNWLN